MSEVAVLCPRCGLVKSTTITMANSIRGITFQGCADCLTAELDALASFRAPQCNVCGTTKTVVVMSQPVPVQRLECPVHVHGRLLLGQALKVLEEDNDTTPGSDRAPLIRDIRQALGVKA